MAYDIQTVRLCFPMWLIVSRIRAASRSWSQSRTRFSVWNLTACSEPCSWHVCGGLYRLANDITNQSREFYCGGPNTLLTRERTINQYRPKSASDLRTRVIGLNYHTRLAGCETCACICAKGKLELWSIVTAEKIGSRSDYILIEFWIISWVDKATKILL